MTDYLKSEIDTTFFVGFSNVNHGWLTLSKSRSWMSTRSPSTNSDSLARNASHPPPSLFSQNPKSIKETKSNKHQYLSPRFSSEHQSKQYEGRRHEQAHRSCQSCASLHGSERGQPHAGKCDLLCFEYVNTLLLSLDVI
jgi:hypothetical protein